jgi:hypothetical protein
VSSSNRKKEKKIKLKSAELEALIGELSPGHLPHVFLYLRADELGEDYLPGRKDAINAHRRLRDMSGRRGCAEQILEYYASAETRRLILPGAEEDPRFEEASQVMRGRLAAPLMAELPAEEAYALWTIAGSWSGALELCGLDPLDGDARRKAVERYATANASPELMPEKYRERLTPECVAALEQICKMARKRGRYPLSDKIPDRARQLVNECGAVIWTVLDSMGIPASDAPKPKKKKVLTGAEAWKASAQWRNTDAYKYRDSPGGERVKYKT